MKKSILVLLLTVSVIAITGCSQKNLTDSVTTEPGVTKTITLTPTPTIEATPTLSPIASDDNLYPAYVYENGNRKYGYIDRTGTFIIQPQYLIASDFSEGIALVTEDNRNKYINKSGEVIFEGSDDLYISAPFVDGVAVFTKFDGTTTKFGYLDTQGNILLDPIYDRADDFNEDGTAFVMVNGNYDKINKSGGIIESYDVSSRHSNILEFKDGYIIYEDPDTQTTGVSDYKGNVILTPSKNADIYPMYNSIIYLGNDLFGVGDNSKGYTFPSLRPYAIFNNKGEQVTDYKFYDVTAFNNEYASVTDDKYTYFINTKGEVATELIKLEGNGTLTINGDVIEASLDGELIYMNRDGSIFWQSRTPQKYDTGLIVNSAKINPNKLVSVQYPVLEGLSSTELQDDINLKLKKLFVNPRKDITIDEGLSVQDSFQSELLGDMLIINRQGYDYYYGAAHGMPIKDYYHINLSTGDIYDLQDLFIDGADYIGHISQIISKRMEEAKDNDKYMYFDGFSKISDKQFFHLTSDGLVIYFYPYDIAPYAAGFPEFLISYDELKDIINYDGPMYKAFQN